MPDYETRTVAVAVGPPGAGLHADSVTRVEITSEPGGGEYIKLEQDGSVAFTPAEWPAIRDAIEAMLKECRDDG